MSILVSANHIGKSFGARPLFEDLTFVVEDNERVGLIGPNGAGKSTLLNILAGRGSVDSGELSFQRGLRVGFLEQTPNLPLDQTVEEAVTDAVADEHDSEQLALAGELLSRLDLYPLADRPVSTLSGGWKKRVALARELVRDPQLLLLDEPTNHLDLESILWLEGFLARAKFATVTVTHDRLFLQRIGNRILELDRRNPQGLLNVRGDFATYLERKEELLQLQQRHEATLKNKLRRETEWLRRGPKARTTKQQARINAAGELGDAVAELEYRNQTRSARLDFQSSENKPKRLIEAKQITKQLGGKTLFKNLDVFIGPGSRIGLLGSNGCGKSTLIRTLLGQETPDHGTILRSDHLKVAYFEQTREMLDQTLTLRRVLCPAGDHVQFRGRMVHIQGYLDRFLFRKEQTDMVVGRLSGGEQSRVLLAKLMLNEANVLVLDEPTNDLDIETLDVLEDVLKDFDGAVLLVTHDRYFLDQVASEILAFSEDGTGDVIQFAGLSQWEDWRLEKAEKKKNKSAPAVETASPAATGDKRKNRKLNFNETRELSQMEAKILDAETRLGKLEAESQRPEVASDAKKLSEIFQSLAKTQLEIETLYARWAELEGK